MMSKRMAKAWGDPSTHIVVTLPHGFGEVRVCEVRRMRESLHHKMVEDVSWTVFLPGKAKTIREDGEVCVVWELHPRLRSRVIVANSRLAGNWSFPMDGGEADDGRVWVWRTIFYWGHPNGRGNADVSTPEKLVAHLSREASVIPAPRTEPPLAWRLVCDNTDLWEMMAGGVRRRCWLFKTEEEADKAKEDLLDEAASQNMADDVAGAAIEVVPVYKVTPKMMAASETFEKEFLAFIDAREERERIFLANLAAQETAKKEAEAATPPPPPPEDDFEVL